MIATFDDDAYVTAEGEAQGIESVRALLARAFIDDHVTLDVRHVIDHHGDFIVRAKYDGTYDKTNLPDPLILTNYYSLRDGQDRHASCILINTGRIVSKIVIFGITGYAGDSIANELLERGHQVIGVARSAGELAPRVHLGVRTGSIYDAALLEKVAQGADAIVVAIRVLQGDGVELATAIPALLKAAEASGARIGMVGGAASLLVAEGGPRVIDAGFPEEYRAEAEAHGRVLESLQAADTAVDWFYVSPPFGFGAHNPGTKIGTFRLGADILITDADGNADISDADFATAFANEIEKPAHHQARFTLGY